MGPLLLSRCIVHEFTSYVKSSLSESNEKGVLKWPWRPGGREWVGGRMDSRSLWIPAQARGGRVGMAGLGAGIRDEGMHRGGREGLEGKCWSPSVVPPRFGPSRRAQGERSVCVV